MLLTLRKSHILANYRGCQTRVIRGNGGSQSRATSIVLNAGSDVTRQERARARHSHAGERLVPRGGGSSVVEVKLDDVDRIEWALKTFKKKVQRAGVLQDLRRKRHYVKPSEARQQKAAAARRRKRSRG